MILAIAALAACGATSARAQSWDPAANRKSSTNYDAVVKDNPAFRANREHAECDSIQSLDLRAQCVASFEGPAPIRPAAGPALPPEDPQRPRTTITNGPVRSPGDE